MTSGRKMSRRQDQLAQPRPFRRKELPKEKNQHIGGSSCVPFDPLSMPQNPRAQREYHSWRSARKMYLSYYQAPFLVINAMGSYGFLKVDMSCTGKSLPRSYSGCRSSQSCCRLINHLRRPTLVSNKTVRQKSCAASTENATAPTRQLATRATMGVLSR
jgi:hypothetical protein